MRKLFFLLYLFLVESCTVSNTVQDTLSSESRYASLLQIESLDQGMTLCRITNPWKPEETIKQYLLVPKAYDEFNNENEHDIEQRYGTCEVIRTPLTHIALSSSCHGYLLSQLDAIDNIAVFLDAEYVAYSETKYRIETQQIINGGSSLAPNIETIISQQCDAIWFTPFENASTGNIEILPITKICCADYMEASPLGRAEWMRFYGRLVDKAEQADSLFALVESNYTEIKDNVDRSSVTNADSSHMLFSELPYQATWYVPGGQSTMGIMYRDAGYRYAWADDSHSGSLALSAEVVLEQAQDADYWLIKYISDHDYTIGDLVAQNEYYGQFKATKDGNVFGCNTRYSDFYDVMPFRPDLLLNELQNLGNGTYFKRLSK